jgi:hypothetical protein
VELKPGLRLKSTADTTELMVVRAPGGDVDLRCGGAPVAPMGDAAENTLDPDFSGGTQIGKRYADEETGLEVLVTKAGPGSLSIGTDALAEKGAKALPSSD